MVFTTLAHHLDEAFLTEALHQLRKDAAAGIDEMTVAEYSQNLEANIADLHQRLVNRKYRAQPARRVQDAGGGVRTHRTGVEAVVESSERQAPAELGAMDGTVAGDLPATETEDRP